MKSVQSEPLKTIVSKKFKIWFIIWTIGLLIWESIIDIEIISVFQLIFWLLYWIFGGLLGYTILDMFFNDGDGSLDRKKMDEEFGRLERFQNSDE